MQQTSLLAFQEIKKELGNKQKEVFNMLKNLGCANNNILAHKLNWEINRVTGRIRELAYKGRIKKAYESKCPYTKRKTIWWKVK